MVDVVLDQAAKELARKRPVRPDEALADRHAAQVKPDLSVLIVSYNTRQMTLKAIRTLRESTSRRLEIIVFDNASRDGSADAIAEAHSDILTIASDVNVGFARANNEAAQYASADYLLLLNPDTEVPENAIDHLLSFAAERPAARIWGGRTLFSDRTPNPSSCWRRPTLWSLTMQASGLSSLWRTSSLFNPERVSVAADAPPLRVDIVSGCLLLIERDLFQRLGGFSQEFFMYGEDADLCLRARRLGARPMVTARATIVHHGGASENVPEDKLVRLLTAKTLLLERHFESRLRGAAQLLLGLWPWSRMAAHRVLAALGRAASVERSRIWSAVWARRAEWRQTSVKS